MFYSQKSSIEGKTFLSVKFPGKPRPFKAGYHHLDFAYHHHLLCHWDGSLREHWSTKQSLNISIPCKILFSLYSLFPFFWQNASVYIYCRASAAHFPRCDSKDLRKLKENIPQIVVSLAPIHFFQSLERLLFFNKLISKTSLKWHKCAKRITEFTLKFIAWLQGMIEPNK